MSPVLHPLSDADRRAMAQIRQQAAPARGVLERAAFDTVMEHTPPAGGMMQEAGTVGGVPGWWSRPPGAPAAAAILYLHGGAYVLGSAAAYRNFVGQIAHSAGLAAFAPDYRLAPEHPFPAAVDDAQAVYRGLGELGFSDILLVGDSAGGGLTLVLLALASASARDGRGAAPRAAAVMSPWTDLALTGATLVSKAEADPLLTPAALHSAAAQYLGAHDPRDPKASPLYGDLAGLASVMIQVGGDEILLDDARRYAERMAAAGGEIQLHQWAGMPHVFPANIGVLTAAQPAVDAIGSFLRRHGRSDHLNGELQMTRVLFVGQAPDTVDFSDPALPRGFDAEKIQAGIDLAVAKIAERGWQGDLCMIAPDAGGVAMLEKQLAGATYDCVVIGGGLRLPPKSLGLFETVVNAVHKGAPGAAIAFNTSPPDTAEAAARWLKAD